MKKNITTHGNPINIPIDLYRGDTFRYHIKAYDEKGNPFDFTDCEFKMDIKDKIDGTLILSIPNNSFSESFDSEGQSHGTNNLLYINHNIGMEELDVKAAVYDIEMKLPNDDIMTLQRGNVTIRFDVTLSSTNG